MKGIDDVVRHQKSKSIYKTCLCPPNQLAIVGQGKTVVRGVLLCIAHKKLPEPDHGEGIEGAVFVELFVDLGFALWGGVRVDCFLVGSDGHHSILDAVKVAVGEVRADSGEHGLNTP